MVAYIKDQIPLEEQLSKYGKAYVPKFKNVKKKNVMVENKCREQIKGITITLGEDVVLGLEEFFTSYFTSLENLSPPGNIEGFIGGILDITKTETISDDFNKILKLLYEDFIGDKVSMENLAIIVDATE